MTNKKIDVIVIGAGPAGISAAKILADNGKKVLIVDRANEAGEKNMFGGAIYTHQTQEIFPEFWKSAPIERGISEQKIFMLTDTESNEINNNTYKQNEFNAYSVNRAKWDKWCVEEIIKKGGYYAPKTLVKELIIENNKVVGIQTELERYYANIVIIADGVNSLLSKQIGLRKDIKDKDVTLNVKEVIKLPKDVIENRFNLDENSGCACKILGGPLKDMFALGFMYTNKESISIGFGVGLDELKKIKKTPYELLDELKNHPAIHKYIKDGETIEYSAHMIPEGGFNCMPKLYADGVMVVGDAAMFVNNVHMEGTNLAMLSGKLAAVTAIEALNQNDFSKKTLSLYEKKIKNSIIYKDLKTHKNTISVLKKNIKTLTTLYPELIGDFIKLISDADGIDKRTKYLCFVKKIITTGAIFKTIPLAFMAMGKCIKR